MPDSFSDLISSAAAFHPWDAMAPGALQAITAISPFDSSMETGCGGSTIVLSHSSARHYVFAIEGEDRTVSELKSHPAMNLSTVQFVVGESWTTLPRFEFPQALNFVLLDGPHAYPMPQMEFVFTDAALEPGGFLALDDIQIPSVYELYRFLRSEKHYALSNRIGRTAIFKKLALKPASPDGWQFQGMNHRTILRYSWRDVLRRMRKRG